MKTKSLRLTYVRSLAHCQKMMGLTNKCEVAASLLSPCPLHPVMEKRTIWNWLVVLKSWGYNAQRTCGQKPWQRLFKLSCFQNPLTDEFVKPGASSWNWKTFDAYKPTQLVTGHLPHIPEGGHEQGLTLHLPLLLNQGEPPLRDTQIRAVSILY